jgi:hypothetical protein
VAAVLSRARHTSPAQRYPSVVQLVEALAATQAGVVVPPPTNRPTSAGQRVLLVDEQPRFGRWVATAGILGLIAVAAMLVVGLPGKRGRPAPPAAPVTAAAAAVKPRPTPAPDSVLLPPLPPVERVAPRQPEPRPASQSRMAAEPPAASRPVTPAATPQGEGALVISSMPWGRLFIDGQPVGTTPKERLTLSAGTHRVEILRDGYHPFRLEIHITPGQEVRLVNIALEAMTP